MIAVPAQHHTDSAMQVETILLPDIGCDSASMRYTEVHYSAKSTEVKANPADSDPTTRHTSTSRSGVPLLHIEVGVLTPPGIRNLWRKGIVPPHLAIDEILVLISTGLYRKGDGPEISATIVDHRVGRHIPVVEVPCDGHRARSRAVKAKAHYPSHIRPSLSRCVRRLYEATL